MVGVGEFFSGMLKGDFLIKGNSFRNWKVIFIVLGMSIVMITCSHQTDEKVMRIASLQKKIRSLKAEYVDSATKVTRLKMESSIKDKVISQGLVSSKEPPVKIVVKTSK
ncbi:FtsL-like putative cell division protein [Wenyingzhuangia sp. 2_MG-2023]|uniref:FtsL-like putative cell division protein n=1 Tax=Wenyingzhuangia sp. 2_MG-2023 TaxID=3062639 RepID=UPI0026E30FE2|nr:FtsL-like putative cell division protein [Wenyingzhuangia sp. 2_MG-2023]MDO6737698.1 FtsL-like putative cell division protein [Wenyingzhuangia sp. 2_MG-2023]MDO6802537.1 FtsL-like putative cell division protein [Wenyingzhuangia sp. 1_MG-2023]